MGSGTNAMAPERTPPCRWTPGMHIQCSGGFGALPHEGAFARSILVGKAGTRLPGPKPIGLANEQPDHRKASP